MKHTPSTVWDLEEKNAFLTTGVHFPHQGSYDKLKNSWSRLCNVCLSVVTAFVLGFTL